MEFQFSSSRICAVVPAAGRGMRLAADVPKVFVRLLPSLTIWDAIRAGLSGVAERIVLILSPEGQNFVETNQADFEAGSFNGTQIVIQSEPLGMGDAIFGAAEFWREYDDLLIVWGDQFNLSLETLRACVVLHATQARPAITLPVVRAPQPYVEYRFDSRERLMSIRQSREGDVCEAGGFSDVGVFLLSGGRGLIEEWERYRSSSAAGSVTREINFLPFLVHLACGAGWSVGRYEVADPMEALGINTPEDLAVARRMLEKKATDPRL